MYFCRHDRSLDSLGTTGGNYARDDGGSSLGTTGNERPRPLRSLPSEESSFTTGSVLMVEGGWNAA